MTPKKTTKKSSKSSAKSSTKSSTQTKAESKTSTKAAVERASRKVHVLGSLDSGIDEVDKLLAAGDVDIVLDFSGCVFITVEGLEWLEELLLRSQSKETEIRLVNMNPPIYKTFKVARIDSILRACGGLAAEVASVC